MALNSMIVKDDTLLVLDQLQLPNKVEYFSIENSQDSWTAIKTMKVRGAPAIALVALFGVAKEILISLKNALNNEDFVEKLKKLIIWMKTSRPTSVNITNMLDYYENEANKKLSLLTSDPNRFVLIGQFLWDSAVKELKKDLTINMAIGSFGKEIVLSDQIEKEKKLNIMTICNTGSLASSGYGTALGVIRSLNAEGLIEMVYCTETRPYNQGSRLTTFELLNDKISGTLICDNMIASLMHTKRIHAAIAGADRVAKNGDVANKIGTFQMALLCQHFKVPFYIACTISTFDLKAETGESFTIEERPGIEMRTINGIQIAVKDFPVWNPAFDVTPRELITGYITEIGAFKSKDFNDLWRKAQSQSLFF